MDITGFVTAFIETPQISIFEAIMLLCWGVSYPVSILKTLRTKKAYGKSPVFMSLIAIGYVSAILYKVLSSCDYLVFLYPFNLSMILIDLYLYTRYNPRDTEALKRKPVQETATDKIRAAPSFS